MMSTKPQAVLLSLSLAAAMATGCGPSNIDEPKACTGYTALAHSVYVLPIPAGSNIRVKQSNCTDSHNGNWRYGYDFEMVEGTSVYAARAGTVIKIKEDVDNGTKLLFNYVHVRHSDFTVARYQRMKKDGVVPVVNDVLTQGQLLGTSGNTDGSPVAHLHFDVVASASTEESIPVTFRNAGLTVAEALKENATYRADPYTPSAN